MFLRVEKMLKADEEVKKEQTESKEAAPVDVEMKSDLLDPTPNPVQVQPTDLGVKAVDYENRFISCFRGRTIHGLNVDVPTGYTGLLLQGDPQPTVTHGADHRVTHVSNAGVKSGLEGEDGRAEKEVDSGTQGGRNTRSRSKGNVTGGKGKGKAKQEETTKTALKPKGRLARTAAPKRPEVIIVDNEDEEMADPVPPEPEPTVEDSEEVPNHLLEPTNDNTNAPDESSLDNDSGLDVDIDMSLRKLTPQSTFSSITLWHADRAVDETRDEYYRTLTEWMALSHEVSKRLKVI
jgi:ribonuclease H2 subunit C